MAMDTENVTILAHLDAITVKAPAVIILSSRSRLSADAFERIKAQVDAAKLPEGIKVMLVEDMDVMAIGAE